MNHKRPTAESIKRILNQSVAQMDEATIENLRATRNRALERHRVLRQSPALAWLNQHGVLVGSPSDTRRHRSWALTLVLIACLFGAFSYMQPANKHEHDHSEIDIAILIDDLPVDAYVE